MDFEFAMRRMRAGDLVRCDEMPSHLALGMMPSLDRHGRSFCMVALPWEPTVATLSFIERLTQLSAELILSGTWMRVRRPERK